MKTTLKAIIRKASKNKKFLNALTKNAQGALKDYDLELSADNLKVLRSLVGGKVSTKERRLLRVMATEVGFGAPWPPPWDKVLLRETIEIKGIEKLRRVRSPKRRGR